MSGIFISYRRSDSPDATGRIYDRLVAEFGKARVFKDVDSIPLGQDFRGHLNEVVGGCAAVLAIIGPRWIDTRNNAGQRRLDDADDFVRIELEAALARDIPVVPVLVAHAPIPGAAELPASMASMAFRQSIEVRPDPDFHNDATRLVVALKKILDPGAAGVETDQSDTTAFRVAAARRGRSTSWLTAALAIVSVLAVALALPALRHLREVPPPEMRAEISTPDSDRPQDVALSPDGRQLAFTARDGEVTRLWLRQLDSDVARPLAGTDDAMDPFWSPDSGSIAFFTSGALKRIDLAGGLVREVVRGGGPPGTSLGGSWSQQGDILYSLGPGGIVRVRDTGGKSAQVIKAGAQLILYVGPEFVGDGRQFIYTQINPADGRGGIFLGSMAGGTPVKLVDAVSRGTWHRAGWLLWEHDGSLLAQRLDLERGTLTGKPVAIANKMVRSAGARASVAINGLLVYRRAEQVLTQLQWFDRKGVPSGVVGEPEPGIRGPQIATDGRIAVARILNGNQDVWVFEGPRLSRLTHGAALDAMPLWFPEERSLVYTAMDADGINVYRKPVTGDGQETALIPPSPDVWSAASSISPDGQYLLVRTYRKENRNADLFLQSIGKGAQPVPWLQTPFEESFATFSPDGRLVAYASDATGRWEVYVRPFHPPDAQGASDNPDAKTVSLAGGSIPVWRRDGKEIYFLNARGELMFATVAISGSTLSIGTPERLFPTRMFGRENFNNVNREYDVAPDGRFLINSEVDTGVPSPIVLIQNWNPEAKRQP